MELRDLYPPKGEIALASKRKSLAGITWNLRDEHPARFQELVIEGLDNLASVGVENPENYADSQLVYRALWIKPSLR